MANAELVASIDVNDLGLGGGQVELNQWHTEMLVLTREMRDALVQMSFEARQEGFFGGEGGGFFANVGGKLAAVVGTVVATVVSGGYVAQVFKAFDDYINETVTYGRPSDEYEDVMADYVGPLKGQGTYVPPEGRDDSVYVGDVVPVETPVQEQRTLNQLLDDQNDAYTELITLRSDLIPDEEQMTRFQEIKNELLLIQNELLRESSSEIEKTALDETKIIDALNDNEALQNSINDLLGIRNEMTKEVEDSEQKVNRQLSEQAALLERIARLRAAARVSKRITVTDSVRGSTRIDYGDRTFAVFDTPTLGGTKAFEIRSPS